VLIAFAVTGLMLYFAFRGVDTRYFGKVAATQERGLFVGASLLIVLQIMLGAERWRAILNVLVRHHHLPSRISTQAVFYASAFVNCFPLGNVGGDITRVWITRRFNLPLNQVVMSVLVDHVLALMAPIALAVMLLPGTSHPLAPIAWMGGMMFLILAALALYFLHFIERLLGRWRYWSAIRLLLDLAEELQILLRHRMMILAAIYALLSSTCSALAAYCIAVSLGIEISATTMIAIMSMVTLVSVLPISFAGWGVREVSLVALLGALGVAHERALLLSVEIGLLSMLMALPGGLSWLGIRKSDLAVNRLVPRTQSQDR
jgi:uncharacterized membrane protein YbhN (UPF0104 family)